MNYLQYIARVYGNITCKNKVRLHTIYYIIYFSGATCAYRTVLNFDDAKLQ